MFVGHLGIALAAKSRRTETSIWVFVVAALLLEPFEHWLVLASVLPVLAALLTFVRFHDLGLAVLVAATAFSHYAADLLTSYLELSSGGREIGLGWYRYPLVDFALEGALIVGGWHLYARPHEPSGRWSEWQLPLLLCLLGAQALFSFLVAPSVV